MPAKSALLISPTTPLRKFNPKAWFLFKCDIVGSIAALALNLLRATSCLYLDFSFMFLGISICVFSICVVPLNPLSVLAIVGLVPPICSLTRWLCANDSSKVLLSWGLPENRFIEVMIPVFRPLVTATFVPN